VPQGAPRGARSEEAPAGEGALRVAVQLAQAAQRALYQPPDLLPAQPHTRMVERLCFWQVLHVREMECM
jgi:hypothetical protein